MLRILSVGLEPVLLAARNRLLVRRGFSVRGAATRTDALRIAKSERFEIVLIGDQIPQGYAAELADQLRHCLGCAPIVFVPEEIDEASIREVEKLGNQESRIRQAA